MTRILFVEDTPADMLLLTRVLEREGLEFVSERVETLENLGIALREDWDFVLSDYHLPGFTAFEVLKTVGGQSKEVPVIVVSSAVGDESAAELMRAGAADFVRKDRPSRLASAIRRELAGTQKRLVQREQYEHLANAMPQIVWTAQADGKLDYFNQAWFDYSGATHQEHAGAGWAAAVHPDDIKLTLDRWHRSNKLGEDYYNEFRLRRADGQYRWHLARALPVRDKNGQILKWYGTNTDIHQQKLTASSLAAAQARLELAMKGANIGTWFFDQLSGEIQASPLAVTLLGATQEKSDVFGMIQKCVHPDDRERVEAGLRLAIDNRREYADEFRVLKTEGEVRWIRSMARWAEDSQSEIQGMSGILYDFTDEKFKREQIELARAAAEDASAAKSEFLANMSHEIRTPLAAIIGFADLMENDAKLTPDERTQFLATIRRNGKSLTRIIDDILDLAKVESGKIDFESIGFSMRALLEEVRELFIERARAKNLSLQVQWQGDVPDFVESDPARLRQILINIVGNSIKFTQQGSVEIDVSAAKAASFADFEIVVRDTGIGISAEKRAHLFQPFSQADNSVTRRFGGTGLGLALSNRLAQALGGAVSFVEPPPALGTSVKISFRAKVVSENQLSAPVKQPQEMGKTSESILAGMRVLVVDDSPDNQILISRILKKHGALTDTANNGADAVRRAQGQSFDVVLMDIQMPEMDGYEATRCLRAAGYKSPIIALTAHAMAEERLRSIHAGCDGHLTKPINQLELVETLSHYKSKSLFNKN